MRIPFKEVARFYWEGEFPGLVALLSFLIVVPFSFVYYYQVARGFIHPLPFYLQRSLPLLLCVLLLPRLALDCRDFKRFIGVIGGALCLFLVSAMTTLGCLRLTVGVDAAGESIAAFQTKVFAQYFIYFLIGCYSLREIAGKRRVALIALGAMAAQILFFFDFSSWSIRLAPNDTSYLSLADAFAIWSIFAFAVAPRRFRAAMMIACLIGTAALISRATVAAFAIVAALWFLTVGFTVRRCLWLGAVAAVAAFAFFPTALFNSSRLLRGYTRFSPNDAGLWRFSNGGKVSSERTPAGDALVFFGPPNAKFSLLFPGEGLADEMFRCKVFFPGEFQLFIQCATNKGDRYLVYRRGPSERTYTIENPAYRDARLYLYREVIAPPRDAWGFFSRDLAKDLNDFGKDYEFLFIQAAYLRGAGKIMDIQTFKKKLMAILPDNGVYRACQKHFAQWDYRLTEITAQLPALWENWWWGDFAGQIRYFDGTLGHYMHNYLSFWRQYGALPFLLFVGLYLVQYVIIGREYFRVARRDWAIELRKCQTRRRFGALRTTFEARCERLKSDNPALLFTFLLATFNLFEIVFARSYATPYAWLSLGMMPAYLATRFGKKNAAT